MILLCFQVRLDVCIYVGLSILQYSKLHMNRYHYDCLDKYVPREDYQMINMDTDSSYVALSGPFNTLIRSELREQFLSEYGKWYVQPYCPEHEDEFRDCFRNTRRVSTARLLSTASDLGFENPRKVQS